MVVALAQGMGSTYLGRQIFSHAVQGLAKFANFIFGFTLHAHADITNANTLGEAVKPMKTMPTSCGT